MQPQVLHEIIALFKKTWNKFGLEVGEKVYNDMLIVCYSNSLDEWEHYVTPGTEKLEKAPDSYPGIQDLISNNTYLKVMYETASKIIGQNVCDHKDCGEKD